MIIVPGPNGRACSCGQRGCLEAYCSAPAVVASYAELKRKEEYSHVMQHIRCSLHFALLRATLVAVRGVRGRGSAAEEDELDNVSFNLISQTSAYESY